MLKNWIYTCAQNYCCCSFPMLKIQVIGSRPTVTIYNCRGASTCLSPPPIYALLSTCVLSYNAHWRSQVQKGDRKRNEKESAKAAKRRQQRQQDTFASAIAAGHNSHKMKKEAEKSNATHWSGCFRMSDNWIIRVCMWSKSKSFCTLLLLSKLDCISGLH